MIVIFSKTVYDEDYRVAIPQMANILLLTLSEVIVRQTTTGILELSSGDLLRVHDAMGSVWEPIIGRHSMGSTILPYRGEYRSSRIDLIFWDQDLIQRVCKSIGFMDL